MRTASMPSALLLLAGCNDLPPIKYETEYLVIGTAFDGPLCAGTLHELDRQVQVVEEALDFQVEGKLELYLFEDIEQVTERCDTPARGCYSRSKKRAYAIPPSSRHEIVHAATGQLHHNAAVFLDEGFAVDLIGDGLQFPNTYPSSNLGLGRSEVSYPTAGHFMRWLRSQYTPSEIKSIYRHSKNRDGSRTHAAFTKATGATFAEIEQAYLASSPEFFPPFDIVTPPTMASEHGGWDLVLDFDCEQIETMGYNDEMWRRVRIEVTSPGRYVLLFTRPAASATLTLRRTEVVEVGEPLPKSPAWPIHDDLFDSPKSQTTTWLPNVPRESWLEVGIYDIELRVPGVTPTMAAVRIHPQLGPISELP